MLSLRRFGKGQTKLAYGLMLSLVAVAVIIGVLLFGRAIQGLFSNIYDKLGAVFSPEPPTSVEPIEEVQPTPPAEKPPRKPPRMPIPKGPLDEH
jgi:Flp pilus assembly pilin Flp